jgi:catechol 2,3-dioxygenase
MENNYIVPSQTSIGHVHLKVADLNRALDFYHGLLGFEITQLYGDSAAFLSAGGYHHHIGLNTWQSKNATPAQGHHTGLFHLAILYPTRQDLALIFKRLKEANYPFDGASDHGVSEVLYLTDPDKNGVELYWDRPKEAWPLTPEGNIDMFTKHLDLDDLLKTIE